MNQHQQWCICIDSGIWQIHTQWQLKRSCKMNTTMTKSFTIPFTIEHHTAINHVWWQIEEISFLLHCARICQTISYSHAQKEKSNWTVWHTLEQHLSFLLPFRWIFLSFHYTSFFSAWFRPTNYAGMGRKKCDLLSLTLHVRFDYSICSIHAEFLVQSTDVVPVPVSTLYDNCVALSIFYFVAMNLEVWRKFAENRWLFGQKKYQQSLSDTLQPSGNACKFEWHTYIRIFQFFN